MPRKILLGNLQQDHRGERITSNILINLKASKLQEIRDFCPTATRLLYSTLGINIYVLDGFIHLECLLLENHQSQLIFEMAGRPHIGDNYAIAAGGTDVFSLEYWILNTEITNLPATTLVATSPALTRDEVQAQTPEAVDRRKLRKASRSHNGVLLEFPGATGPTRLNVPEVPKLLPTGTQVEIIATVVDLPSKRALLGAIQPLDRGQASTAHFSLSPKMLARRQIHGDASSMGALLLESRDHRMPIRIRAVVLDSWEDGEHCLLDILEVKRLSIS